MKILTMLSRILQEELSFSVLFAVLTTEYVCDSRSKELLEYQSGHISIHPRFNKLITALRTAIADEWSLDKKATSHDDLLVAFSMSLQY